MTSGNTGLEYGAQIAAKTNNLASFSPLSEQQDLCARYETMKVVEMSRKMLQEMTNLYSIHFDKLSELMKSAENLHRLQSEHTFLQLPKKPTRPPSPPQAPNQPHQSTLSGTCLNKSCRKLAQAHEVLLEECSLLKVGLFTNLTGRESCRDTCISAPHRST